MRFIFSTPKVETTLGSLKEKELKMWVGEGSAEEFCIEWQKQRDKEKQERQR